MIPMLLRERRRAYDEVLPAPLSRRGLGGGPCPMWRRKWRIALDCVAIVFTEAGQSIVRCTIED